MAATKERIDLLKSIVKECSSSMKAVVGFLCVIGMKELGRNMLGFYVISSLLVYLLDDQAVRSKKRGVYRAQPSAQHENDDMPVDKFRT